MGLDAELELWVSADHFAKFNHELKALDIGYFHSTEHYEDAGMYVVTFGLRERFYAIQYRRGFFPSILYRIHQIFELKGVLRMNYRDDTGNYKLPVTPQLLSTLYTDWLTYNIKWDNSVIDGEVVKREPLLLEVL